MRVEATVRGRSVTIQECRPLWPDAPSEWVPQPLAQLRYDAVSQWWTLHWADRNSRWHHYDDLEPGAIETLLQEIADDPTCIFWG